MLKQVEAELRVSVSFSAAHLVIRCRRHASSLGLARTSLAANIYNMVQDEANADCRPLG